MSNVQRQAIKRAHDAGGVELVRNGRTLVLAVGATYEAENSRTRAKTYQREFPSAAKARAVEEGFRHWLVLVPSLRRAPEAALGLATRYVDHLDSLERELTLQLEAHPDWTIEKALARALLLTDCALHRAHRRAGRRWS